MAFGLMEYQAARQAAGLADLSFWPRFRFSGPDAKPFLNGLLTNDILALAPGKSRSACLLTPKGKLLADMELYDEGESLLAVMRPMAAAQFKAAISKRIPLSKTTMRDVGAEEALFYLSGPKAQAVLDKIKTPLKALPYRLLDEDGLLIVFPAAQGAALWKDLRDAGATTVSWHAFEMRRVERGMPLYGVDMNADNMPLEMRLERAISMAKGCYMGQETVSRIVNLGHVNKILVGLKGSKELLPATGWTVSDSGKEVGRITSAAFSPLLESAVALATVSVERSKPGTRLEARGGGKILQVEAVDLFTST